MIKLISAGVLAFIVIVSALVSFTTIETQERGIVTRFGEVVEVLEPGAHFVNPFTSSVTEMDVSVRALPVEKLSYSKDSQTVAAQVTVTYQVNPSMVTQVFTETRNDYEARYLIPNINGAIEAVFTRYTAQGIVDNRSKLPAEIQLQLGDLAARGIIISKVELTNFDFDDAYEEAVKNKQVQEQQALAQVNITKQEEEKKKQEILKAEALAEKTRLEAAALASQNGDKVIGKIYAEAALAASQKWDGKMPVNMYANAPMPFIKVENAVTE